MGDDAQLMLLGAILLVVGFLALSATVARLDQVPAQAEYEQDDPFPAELQAVQAAMVHLANRTDLVTEPGPAAGGNLAALNRALDQLEMHEASRGFFLDASAAVGPSPSLCGVTFFLSSGASMARGELVVSFGSEACS